MARPKWMNRTTFLLAAIGSAVGLGNVWRFPYLTYEHGGGAFLIPYLIALFLIGVPLLMVEFAIGQKLQKGAVGAFKGLNKKWGGLGVFALLSAFIVIAYYAVVMAWSLLYFFASFSVKWAGDSSGYFFNTILNISDGVGSLGSIQWPIFLSLIAVWALIYFSIWKGVNSVGKVVWWTVPLPILLLVVLLIRGVTLPGFMTGWEFYLTPDFSALLDPKVWVAAISQIFFTLTLAMGVMVAYASYNKGDDVRGNTWITALVNSGISLFSGFVVFAILGYMATNSGVAVSEVVASGPGLAFVVFPEALSLMPLAWLFSLMFFLTLLTLGIDSAFSLVEAVNASLSDSKWGKKMKVEHLSLLVCGLLFLAGIVFTTSAGLYILDIVDHFVVNYNIVLAGILTAILVGWVYGAKKLRTYINSVSKRKVGSWFDFSVKFVIPICLVALLITQFVTDVRVPYEGYPMWALWIGWAVFVVPTIIFVFSLLRPSRS